MTLPFDPPRPPWRKFLAYDFEVFGTPAPQGSKRHVGNGVMVESSKKVKPWRADVRDAALAVRNGRDLLDGPLIADMVFTFLRPRGHYRTGRNNHLLRDGVPPQPCVMPDLSKLVRSTEDAITKILWTDDARVVEYGRLAKVYVGSDPDALDRPGALIRIYRLENS